MIDRVLDLIAPHICCFCGESGAVFCEDCYFDIVEEPFSCCVVCLQPTLTANLCRGCRQDLQADDIWVVSDRTEAIKRLIDAYKFERVKRAGNRIAQLLMDRVPTLPPETVICYVPDIAAHRRQRGYDHMAHIAKQFGKYTGLAATPLLTRRTHISQRSLSRSERLRSQKDAFIANGQLPSTVLLLDDIYTTGGTFRAAIQALRQAGVGTVYGAIVARQPLDETRDL